MAFWSPKQLYYMWQWKVEIFARNWGWSFKHETSTSHLGRGQLREAQIFSQRWSLHWSLHWSLGQEFGQVPVPWNGAWKHGRFETQFLLQINSENGLNSLTGSLWRVFHEVATWNHMKGNRTKIHENPWIQRIRISRVFWSLSSSSAAWRHCGWTAPWRRRREFWGSRFPISTQCVNACYCLINVLCLSELQLYQCHAF